MLPSVLTLLDFAASGVAVADTGAQGVMPFPFGLLDGASDTGVTPTPTPTPTPVGGWVYDPYSRRRRRRDDEEPAPRPVPTLEPVPDRTDEIAALDARIAELGETIAKSRRGRERMRARMRDLETERAVMARAQERRLRLLDDEDWFMMS